MHRNLFSRAGAALAAGLLVLTAYAAYQDVTLRPKPKSGDVRQYKVTATFQTGQGEVIFNQVRKETIGDVKPDGVFTVKAVSSDTRVTFGGQELPEQPESNSSEELGPDGMLKSISADLAGGQEATIWRLANLHAFKAPETAKVGDEIAFDIPADAKLGTPPVKCVYKVVGTEKVKDWDCVKLTFTSTETEGDPKSSVKGTLWVGASDGFPVKSSEEWKDVQPGGAPFPVSGTFTVERVK